MNKFSVDYSGLQSKLSAKKAYLLSEVKDKIKKVAFDVVRFVDSDNIEELWQIQRQGDDEYIVAMYDAENTKTASKAEIWKVVPNGSKTVLSVFHNGNPITNVKLASLGLAGEDVFLVSKTFKDKLAEDKNFLNMFVNDLTADEVSALEDSINSTGLKHNQNGK